MAIQMNMHSILILAAIFAASPLAFADQPDAPEGMQAIPAGVFQMGYAGGAHDERPLRAVRIDAFYLDTHEVTNAQFARFVAETGHVTQAERDGYAWAYEPGTKDFQAISGASWRHPNGPDTTIDRRAEHPVVCVSWHDAAAFATWAGKRLPTEAEWEYAARAGMKHRAAIMPSHHGDAPALGHVGRSTDLVTVEANVWQGAFPTENREDDGYYYTAPVGSFPANAWGLRDMVGNVWEWCADWYAPDAYTTDVALNPQGARTGTNRVARGGSWFCSSTYCGAYNTHFRGASPPTHSFSNVGFRCAKSAGDRGE